MKLKEIGEFGFIDRIAPLGDIRRTGVVKGIGDDCAVLEYDESEYQLVTTDLLVERVHFRMDWTTPEQLGSKALAVNLSDIAACGGVPYDAFVSLVVPDRIEVEWLEALYRGMSETAREFDVNLLGGDTTSSLSDFIISVAVTGRVPKSEILYRNTARAGDYILVTGPLGLSAAGLEMKTRNVDAAEHVVESLMASHLTPKPHVREGRMLARSGFCTAAIDVSDGLSSDLRHLCQESGLAAEIYEASIEPPPELIELSRVTGRNPLEWILNGGEDYVLLAAVDPNGIDKLLDDASEWGRRFMSIGRFVEGSGMNLIRSDGSVTALQPGGWDHFR